MVVEIDAAGRRRDGRTVKPALWWNNGWGIRELLRIFIVCLQSKRIDGGLARQLDESTTNRQVPG